MEEGERPLEAAKRELYEETGALDFDILPVWDYSVFNDEGVLHNNGRFYFAEIRSFDNLPNNSEMQSIDFFSELPISVSYNRDKMWSDLLKAEKIYLTFKRNDV